MPRSVLSIITITYKDPKGLQATLDSLRPLLEAGVPFEHVIVDSSAEENKSILSSLPQSWPLRHIVEPAKGIYAAMNKGVAAATGEFAWILNGGDRLRETSCLLESLDFLEANPQTEMLTAGAALYRSGTFQYSVPAKATLFRQLVGINKQCQQAILYRRRALEEIGPFPERYRLVADYFHHWEFYLRKKLFATSPAILVAYDMGGSSGNVRTALSEMRKAQRELAPRLPLLVNWSNAVAWRYYLLKITTMKFLGNTWLSAPLTRAWIFWNRLGQSRQ